MIHIQAYSFYPLFSGIQKVLPQRQRLVVKIQQLFAKIIATLRNLFHVERKARVETVPAQGIANDGNSCFLAIVLHEIAGSLPFHQAMLKTPLVRRKCESLSSLNRRVDLQRTLSCLVEKLASGQGVSAAEMRNLRRLMHQNGWRSERRNLKEFLAGRPGKGDAFQSYNSLCSLLDQKDFLYETKGSFFCPAKRKQSVPSQSIIHLYPQKKPIEEILADIDIEQKGTLLCKVRHLPHIPLLSLPETYRCRGHEYHLKQLHIYEGGADSHNTTYRKVNGLWTHFDDDRVTSPASLPKNQICALHYERT